MSPQPKLLSRDQFREAVFARDRHTCVLCGAPGADAHHILERRLWVGEQAGGYYVANGATVCGPCHLRCESTEITVEEVREAAGILAPVLPDHLYADQRYDKWGNPVLPDGRRLKGELADDESVRRIMATCPVPIEWADRIKYPRTWHLPWSPGATKDDRVVRDCAGFEGRRVIVTSKMDGENTTLYPDGLHARSLDYSPHESRNWVKAMWARVCGDIPEGHRVCGENLYARHSIAYEGLPSYFLAFSLWEGLRCYGWDETLEWAALLGLDVVPVLYDGLWDEPLIRGLAGRMDLGRDEGYVVRLAEPFHYRDFSRAVAKYVRAGHVAGSHWKSRNITPNGLAGR